MSCPQGSIILATPLSVAQDIDLCCFPVVSALESAYSCVCTLSSCTSREECCTSIETRAMCYDWCSGCHTDSCHRYSHQARYFVDQKRNLHLHLLVLSTG